MLNTLRGKLIAVFMLFGLFTLSIVLLMNWGNSKQEGLDEIMKEINHVHLMLLEDSKVIGEFFTPESSSEGFFEIEMSNCLGKHYRLSNEIKYKIELILKLEEIGHFGVMKTLDSIHNEMYYFDINFNKIIIELSKREMQNHALVNHLSLVSDSLLKWSTNEMAVLGLKELENDYWRFKGKSERYPIQKLSYLLIKELKTSDEALDSLLVNYEQTLKGIFMIDKQVSLYVNSGLKVKLDIQLMKLEKIINQTVLVVREKKDLLSKRLKTIVLFYALFLVVLMVFVGMVLAFVISSDVTKLSTHLVKLVKSDFMNRDIVRVKSKKGELNELVRNVRLLQQKVIGDIDELEQKVSKRTIEIESQKEELLAQHETVVAQKDFILKQNKVFTDSLNYAKKIQEATMPSEARVKRIFPYSFILYKPKQQVSGDFYWMKEHVFSGKQYKLFAVADCTGHGVPDAFMSLLGISFLNDLLLKITSPDPGEILDKLKHKVIKAFHGEGVTPLADGMDISFGVVDIEENVIYFAGANHNLHLIREGRMTVVKGDRIPIGYYPKENKFTTQKIQLLKGDNLYFFTDGYPDQFSSITNKKYYVKRFKETLQEIHLEPLEEQKKLLTINFDNWRSGGEQTDDVLVMGLKIMN